MGTNQRNNTKVNGSPNKEKSGEYNGNQKKTKTNGNGKHKEKKVDELHYIDQKLEENNGNAYFDWLIAMPIGCGYCVSLQILIPFLIQMPSFLCSNDGSSWNSCLASDFCNAVSPPMHMFDNSASSTITNWITDRNLICISSFNLGLFGSIYMCGYAFGALTILRLGDIIGRKPILVLCSASNTIIYFLLYFTRETYLIYGLLFIDGAMRMTKGSLAYILMLETIPMKKRSKLNSIVMSLEGCTKFMIVALIYYFNDALTVLFLTAIFAFIQSCFVFLSPESPKFLYSIGRKKEANESLRYIAKVNGADFKGIDIEKDDDKDEKDGKSNNKSLFEALKDPLYRKNILVMTFVFCVSFMSYYVIGYYIGSFPGNMFINAFAVITSDIIGSGLCTVWLNTFGLRNGFSVMYIIVVFSAIVYYLSSETLMVTYACVFTIRFGLTLAVSISLFACAQIFETKLQARSFAFCNFAGRIATILSPLIVTLAPSPLLIITLFSIAAAIIVQLLQVPDE